VGEHFLAQGIERFLFVGDVSYSENYWRHKGRESALAEISNSPPHEVVVINNYANETSYDAANRFFDTCDELPDAIFAYSDTAAMAVICALRNRGIDVPHEVSVVGYNDIPSAVYFSPPITTVRQDTYQAGKLLVDKLMQMLDGEVPQSETINTELVKRAT
jgi:DNA-binding LacI/PurR family transcriptional regulator